MIQNFRDFKAGPDPFGRMWQVYFRWLQTGISIRHADTVDVKFILVDENGKKIEKTIALPNADLRQLSRDTGRPLEDPWCARLAAAIGEWATKRGKGDGKPVTVEIRAAE